MTDYERHLPPLFDHHNKDRGADGARHHAGLTVQRAIEIMQSHGLDPMRYGFICYDQWNETPEVVDPELVKSPKSTARLEISTASGMMSYCCSLRVVLQLDLMFWRLNEK